MFLNLHEVYPEVNYHLLINKFTEDQYHLTMQQLIEKFGDERVMKMSNNSDPHWLIVDIN